MGLSLEQQKRIEERRNEVERRTKDGQTAQQIVDALKGTPLETIIGTIERDRKILKECGRLENKTEQQRIAEEMEAVKILAEAGKTNNEISEIRGISVTTIVSHKKRLREQGNLNILSSEEKEQLVKELTKKGKTVEQIKEITGMSKSTIDRCRKRLREQGELPNRPKTGKLIKMEKRMKKVDKLKDNKTIKEIAEELKVREEIIISDIKRLKEQEIAQLSERVKKLYEDFYGQDDTIEKFEEYLTLCKERYEQQMIDEKDLISIKCATISTQRYENVAFYLKLCIRFNQFEEAIKFAHDYVNCETFSQEEKEKIKQAQVKCQRFIKAISIIKQNINMKAINRENQIINDDEIMEIAGVSEVDVAILKKKVEQQSKKEKTNREPEKKDDGEEQSL